MKMIDHNHFICHLILGTFTEYPKLNQQLNQEVNRILYKSCNFDYLLQGLNVKTESFVTLSIILI